MASIRMSKRKNITVFGSIGFRVCAFMGLRFRGLGFLGLRFKGLRV